jgi:hypothetical protein
MRKVSERWHVACKFFPSNWAKGGQYADISFADTGYSVQLRYGFRFDSKKLLNPANQGNPFYTRKTDISEIVAFLGGNLKKIKKQTYKFCLCTVRIGSMWSLWMNGTGLNLMLFHLIPAHFIPVHLIPVANLMTNSLGRKVSLCALCKILPPVTETFAAVSKTKRKKYWMHPYWRTGAVKKIQLGLRRLRLRLRCSCATCLY